MYKAISKGKLSPISFYKLKTLKLYVKIVKDSMQAMILLLQYSPNLEVLQLCPFEVKLFIFFMNFVYKFHFFYMVVRMTCKFCEIKLEVN